MNKLLISEISIDLHLQSFTHLAQQNLEGKKNEGEKAYPASNPFLYCWTRMCHRRRPPSFTPGWRQEVPGGAGERTNSHSFAPVSILMIAPFPEQAQVLLFRQTLPQIQIQTPTVFSANQPTNYGWNGNQRKQHSLVKVQKHFSLSSTFLNVFFQM